MIHKHIPHHIYPYQGNPVKLAWRHWQWFLCTIINPKTQQLHQPLGCWINGMHHQYWKRPVYKHMTWNWLYIQKHHHFQEFHFGPEGSLTDTGITTLHLPLLTIPMDMSMKHRMIHIQGIPCLENLHSRSTPHTFEVFLLMLEPWESMILTPAQVT